MTASMAKSTGTSSSRMRPGGGARCYKHGATAPSMSLGHTHVTASTFFGRYIGRSGLRVARLGCQRGGSRCDGGQESRGLGQPGAQAVGCAGALGVGSDPDLLKVCFSLPLFRLGTADAINAKLTLPVAGSVDAHRGVVVMRGDDTVGADVDDALKALVVVFTGSPAAADQKLPGLSGVWPGALARPDRGCGRRGQDVLVGPCDRDTERACQNGGGVRPTLRRRAPGRTVPEGAFNPCGDCRPAGGRGRQRPVWHRDCPLRPGGSAPGPRPGRCATPRAVRL